MVPAAVTTPAMPEAALPLTTLSINHEATMDLDSTNAFEGMTLILLIFLRVVCYIC